MSASNFKYLTATLGDGTTLSGRIDADKVFKWTVSGPASAILSGATIRVDRDRMGLDSIIVNPERLTTIASTVNAKEVSLPTREGRSIQTLTVGFVDGTSFRGDKSERGFEWRGSGPDAGWLADSTIELDAKGLPTQIVVLGREHRVVSSTVKVRRNIIKYGDGTMKTTTQHNLDDLFLPAGAEDVFTRGGLFEDREVRDWDPASQSWTERLLSGDTGEGTAPRRMTVDSSNEECVKEMEDVLSRAACPRPVELMSKEEASNMLPMVNELDPFGVPVTMLLTDNQDSMAQFGRRSYGLTDRGC